MIHLQCKDMFRKYVCAVESSLIKTFCLSFRQIGLSGLPSAQCQPNALSTSCKSYLSQIQHSFRRTCKSPHFIIYDQELKAGFGNRNTCGLISRINSNDILFQLPCPGRLNTLVTIDPPESTLHCGLRSQSHGDSSRSSRAPRAVFPPEETAAAGTLPPRALLLSHHCGHHVLLMIDSPVLVAPAHLVPTWCPPDAPHPPLT